jgi:hypothetical protein
MIKFIIQLDKSMCYAGSCLKFFQYKKEPRWCEHSEKKAQKIKELDCI